MERMKIDFKITTISISWEDIVEFRRYARLIKQTKTGDRYVSDADLFKRVLAYWALNHIDDCHSEPKSTYPSLDKSQPSSDSSESN